jgi:hypothetical protein
MIAQREAETAAGARSMHGADGPPPSPYTARVAERHGDLGRGHGRATAGNSASSRSIDPAVILVAEPTLRASSRPAAISL